MQKKLSKPAKQKIDEFLNLALGEKTVQCPYFNNRRNKVRGGVKAKVGKGSPKDIIHEAKIELKKEGISLKKLTKSELKKFLVDSNLGVDCSAFVFYILKEELQASKNKNLTQELDFSDKNLLRRVISWFRPITNINVELLGNEKNSKKINLADIKPADLIFIKKFGPENSRDHILIIHKVDYKQEKLEKIYYTHSFRWDKEGKYDHGVRQGEILVNNTDKKLTKQTWLEKGKKKEYNEALQEAEEGKVELRRLKILD
jgi:hypothetical protein